MLVVHALYGLKSSTAAFRAFIVETLYDFGMVPSQTDLDVWMRPAIKADDFKYYEYILCYIDNILCFSNNPMSLTGLIQRSLSYRMMP